MITGLRTDLFIAVPPWPFMDNSMVAAWRERARARCEVVSERRIEEKRETATGDAQPAGFDVGLLQRPKAEESEWLRMLGNLSGKVDDRSQPHMNWKWCCAASAGREHTSCNALYSSVVKKRFATDIVRLPETT